MTDYIENCEFVQFLFEAYKAILTTHTATEGNEHDFDLDNYDRHNEIRLKDVLIQTIELMQYFRELYSVPDFFVRDSKAIEEVYKKQISYTQYLAYHYDNYVIRIITSIDICGKIGNLLYNLKIQDKYCNWHTFAFHKTIVNTPVSKNLIAISDFLSHLRDARHKKIHWGETANNNFEYIITFGGIEEIEKGDKRNENEIINELFQIEVDRLKSEIGSVSKLTSVFLDSMLFKLKDAININYR